MARIEDLLREEFRRTDQPAVPGRDAMLARVTRVRRRRMAAATALGGGSVVAVVVAAANIVPAGRSGTQLGTAGQPTRLYSAELINVVFTDRQHGYLAQEHCSEDVPGEVPADAPTPDVHRDCAPVLLVTADGGRTWKTRSLPDDPATKDAGVDLVRGHSLMLWIDDSGKLAYGGWNRRYWTTANRGSTWVESPSPRDIGPLGSYGTFTVKDRLTFLATPTPDGIPPKKAEKNPIVAATDGSFWSACATGSCVRVTRNHGTTWQTLSTIDSATIVEFVATADGDTVYASVRTGAGSQLVRSADGGSTWHPVLELPQRAAGGVALAGGDLILAYASDEGGVYRLSAGASALEKLTDAPAHPNALYVTGGVVVAAQVWDQGENPVLGSVVSVSADGGTTWSEVPTPAVTGS
jgi:hypothetical protein